MKKLILVSACLLLLVGCRSNQKTTPESLDKLIDYSILDNYKVSEKLYWNDDNKTLVQISYDNKNNFGRFMVGVFSYKGIDVFSNEKIDIDEYIDYLTHKTTMTINGKTFYIGYTGQDDFDDVNARAYVKDGDYVFEFSMSNFDDFITKTQYREFIEMLKTVELKSR